MRILLDMDDTLVDFINPAALLWGLTRADLEEHWSPGQWDMIHPMRTCLQSWGRADGSQPTVEEFWRRIEDVGARFWERLPPMPWFDDLVKLATSLADGDWHVISSPARCPTCHDGKVRWLKNKFGPSFDRFALAPHKEIFAMPGVALVDDRDDNVRKFRDAGGEAVLLPALHNSAHCLRRDTMLVVRQGLAAAALSSPKDAPRRRRESR